MADGTSGSLTLTDLRDAIVVPRLSRMRAQRIVSLAVLDNAGNYLSAGNCELERHPKTLFVPTKSHLKDPTILNGKWFFGGFASHHFGHQITRSLGRLQDLASAGAIDGILYAPLTRRARNEDSQKQLARLLAGLGIKAEIRQITTTTQVERLLLGPDLFSEETSCIADAAYVAWARNTIRPKTKPVPGSKLYVTRTQLAPSTGRLLCEDVLEQNLAHNGYQVYAPEHHTLAEQLTTYASAETIVTTDGSHGHIMAFARQNGQKIITIARRLEPPQLLLNHINSFGAGLDDASHDYVSCITHEWTPPTRSGNLSLGEGDFATLFDELVRCGALPASARSGWKIPTQNDVEASKALGRQADDRLLSTLEREAFMSDLRNFRKPRLAAKSAQPKVTEAQLPMDTPVTDRPAAPQPDTPIKMRADGMRYFRILKGLHQRLKPDWYLEIGTFTGSSLRFVEGNYVAIDPNFLLEQIPPLKSRESIFFQDTSDAFFESLTAKNLIGKINLAFLDGLHHYEALLRDFINVEPLMAEGGMVILHDCLPYNIPMTDRIQIPKTEWTGDVWKTLLILMEQRPDLQFDLLDAAPTGLVIIRKMNADKGKKMKSRYKSLIEKWDPITLDNYPGGLPAFWEKLTVIPAGPFVDTLPQA